MIAYSLTEQALADAVAEIERLRADLDDARLMIGAWEDKANRRADLLARQFEECARVVEAIGRTKDTYSEIAAAIRALKDKTP